MGQGYPNISKIPNNQIFRFTRALINFDYWDFPGKITVIKDHYKNPGILRIQIIEVPDNQGLTILLFIKKKYFLSRILRLLLRYSYQVLTKNY